MKLELKYNGQTARPEDYSSKDGDLALSLNLISEDGALHPLHEPQTLFTLPSGCRVVFVHATATYKHYIVADTSGHLYWIDSTNASGTVSQLNNQIGTFSGAKSVTAVGNTLVVLTASEMCYVLWKADNSNYIYLGTKPPIVELSFGLSDNKLRSWFDYDDNYRIGATSIADFLSNTVAGDTGYGFSYCAELSYNHKEIRFKNNDRIEEINNLIWALINKSNMKISEDGHFFAPFFVRYCYRMYDGTMWMQSAPVFMPVSMPYAFNVSCANGYKVTPDSPDTDIDINSNITKMTFVYWPENVALTYKTLDSNNEILNELKSKWGDIIKSIDIFVSLPLTREIDNEKITKCTAYGQGDTYHLRDGNLFKQNYVGKYANANNPEVIVEQQTNYVKCEIPLISEQQYLDKIRSVSNFYKILSFDIETASFPNEYTEVSIDKYILQTLATQERMTDDYKSHNTLMPLLDSDGNSVTKLYTNNKRLYVAAPKEILFSGFNVSSIVPYCTSGGAQVSTYGVYVFLNTEEGTRKVCLINNIPYTTIFPILTNCPLFYPDNRAYEMRIVKEYTTGQLGEIESYQAYVFQMKPCSMLNGSMTEGGMFNDIEDVLPYTVYNEDSIVNTVTQTTKLYISEVGNPFIFPAPSINTVGTGTIQAVATVNEPVSQGQFGHSDIYIFCTDGLWVAKIMADGKLESINPVSQDVCTNPAAVVQLAKTVLFPTQRGIMAVAGSRIDPLSDTIDTDNPFDLADLPHLTDPNVLPASLGTPTLPAFQPFIDGCKMLFDYQHQRVVVFNPAVDSNNQRLYPYAYVYSLRSKQWGMMQSGFTDTFNAYPDAMAMSGNAVVTLNTDSTFENQLTVTRPFKLGLPDVLKTIRAMIQRGMFSRGHVKCILYGSRDLVHWQVVGSSMGEAIRRMSGSGYKYFRVAVLSTLESSETLTGATIDAVPKHTNLLI